MSKSISIRRALVSVYHKSGLEDLLPKLKALGVEIYSTGGTLSYLKEQGYAVKSVESLTGYPSIMGGRVKTLHPAVFGGILAREDHENELKEHDLKRFDLVIVDLYPFEETVNHGADHEEIIEKIDIGGISLIRAAAKNYDHCLVIPSRESYTDLTQLLKDYGKDIPKVESKRMAARAFQISSHYDAQIGGYLLDDKGGFKIEYAEKSALRYGENPHQKAWYCGDLRKDMIQIQGKELSFNNLVDIDAGVALMRDLPPSKNVFAVIKHTNACGLALGESLQESWEKALAGDPVSAFGGILITNQKMDLSTAKSINKIFFEILLAPEFSKESLDFFAGKKKKRCLVQYELGEAEPQVFKSLLSGALVQENDNFRHNIDEWESKGGRDMSEREKTDLMLANIAVKHLKSNAIALVKDGQLVGMGCGQTSRIDALRQAAEKAKRLDLPLKEAVMASDAFFPFGDAIEMAHKEGITAVVQPGGSIRDNETIDYAKKHNLCLMLTGVRHFKH
ncbi:MAG TPA: bifunctional phosphoribosylaminoimidazolecarboxamide formyltransferase/IMP cyclohydrolase [Saprospiraceae bacterium]|nr:bifunctional phosphoribosylaminoimidazolecarboxamide formyltransferase/IMP cyclohydrolase [Saprospiraceae bacterium]